MAQLEPLHFSQLKHVGRSAKHYKWNLEHPVQQTRSTLIGSAVDALVYETKPVLVWEGKRVGKEYKQFVADNPDTLILNEKEWEVVDGQTNALLSNREAHQLLRRGQRQTAIKWMFGGRECEGTPDVWTDDCVVDLKTTKDAQPDRFERDARWRGYHAQLAWYRTGLILSGRAKPQTAIIVTVESSAPYDVVIRPLTDRALDQGERLWRGWFERLRVCEECNEWPGYAQGPVDLDVPDDDFELIVGGEAIEF